jgi:hypothetical protein
MARIAEGLARVRGGILTVTSHASHEPASACRRTQLHFCLAGLPPGGFENVGVVEREAVE